MVQGQLNTIPLAIGDPDGDPFTVRLSTSAESLIPSIPAGLGVTPAGVLTWNTTGTSIGQKYAVQVMIEENHPGGATGKVPLDFIIEITDGQSLNQPPDCEINGSHANTVNVGQPFSVSITGTDPNGGSLAVNHLGLPPGATLTPGTGSSGPVPFTVTFAWTPSPADIGSAHAVTVVFSDPLGRQTSCSFSIQVPSNQPPTANAGPDQTLECAGPAGTPVTLAGSGSDPDGDALTYTWTGSFGTASGAAPTISLPVGIHTITLTVSDGKGGSDSDTVQITVEDTTPPSLTLNGADPDTVWRPVMSYADPGATASDVCCATATVAVSGIVDTAQPGTYTLTYTATDCNGNTSTAKRTVVVVNRAPHCEAAAPSIGEIWPPNHKMVSVSILGVTDPDGDPVTITVTKITQDEPTNTQGDGNTPVDGGGIGTSAAQVRAERSGTPKVPGNGRVYHISFTASDPFGGTCDGTVKVCVPHDQGKGKVCVDDGPKFNSVTGAPVSSSKPVATEFVPEADLIFGAENFPNPFNPSTTIRYTLPEASSVRLTIFNVLGQEVRTLVNAAQSRGVHSVQWDGRDAAGRLAATGVYVYRLEAGQFVATKSMVFAK